MDATGIALELLNWPITDAAMMGALAEATGPVPMSSIESVLRVRFREKAGAWEP